MRTLPVELPGREYKIEIGVGNLEESLISSIQSLNPERVVTVTNTTLEKIYPQKILVSIQIRLLQKVVL